MKNKSVIGCFKINFLWRKRDFQQFSKKGIFLGLFRQTLYMFQKEIIYYVHEILSMFEQLNLSLCSTIFAMARIVFSHGASTIFCHGPSIKFDMVLVQFSTMSLV